MLSSSNYRVSVISGVRGPVGISNCCRPSANNFEMNICSLKNFWSNFSSVLPFACWFFLPIIIVSNENLSFCCRVFKYIQQEHLEVFARLGLKPGFPILLAIQSHFTSYTDLQSGVRYCFSVCIHCLTRSRIYIVARAQKNFCPPAPTVLSVCCRTCNFLHA